MKNRYRNVAFLAELLINIFVFSISCAVLVGLFGQAGQISRQTKEEGFATQEIYALFDTVRARGPEGLVSAQGGENGSYILYYDKNWCPAADAQAAAYTVTLQMEDTGTAAGSLYQLDATATDAQGSEICQMTTKTYHPGGEVAA